MAKAKYQTTQYLRYNKLKLAPGAEISLEPKDAKPLLESGAIEKPKPAKQEGTTDTTDTTETEK